MIVDGVLRTDCFDKEDFEKRPQRHAEQVLCGQEKCVPDRRKGHAKVLRWDQAERV